MNNRPDVQISDRIAVKVSEQGIVVVLKLSGHTFLVPYCDDELVESLYDNLIENLCSKAAEYCPQTIKGFPKGLLLLFPFAEEEKKTCSKIIASVLELFQLVKRFNIGKDVAVSIKAAICSGPVMAMPEGIVSDRRPALLGQAVQEAMDLCDFAGCGQILVDDEVQALAVNHYCFQMRYYDEGNNRKKVHALLERLPKTLAREGMLRPNGTLPLVGRSEQLAFFRNSLEDVRQSQGQIIELIGEPGIGKSRLLKEVAEREAGDFVQWTISCTPHSRYISFHLFGELIRRATKTTREDNCDQARRKLQQYIEKLNGSAEDVQTELLLGVMGFPNSWGDMPAVIQRRHATIRGIIDFIKVSALRRPVFLTLDDLHNIDPSSEEVIQELIGEAPEIPILLALAYRSGCTPIWGQNEKNQTILEIQPLSSEQAKEFLKSVMNTDSVSDGHFEQALTLRDNWNPLLIEQLVRKIMTDEIIRRNKDQEILAPDCSECDITDDLLTIIEGRVNGLGQGVRNLLEFSAIIGLSFTIPMLQFLENAADGLREKLSILEGLGFLRKSENNSEYIFHHALTQEVVYESLGEQHRKNLHGKVFQTMIDLHGEENDSHVEMIAYHAVRAELPHESVQYLEKCVEKARAMYSNREAIEYYGQIIKCLISYPKLSDDSDKVVKCFLKRAELSRYIGDFDEATYDLEQALRTAEVLNQNELLASVYKEKALLAATMGQYEEGMDNILMAKKYVTPSGNPAIRMRLANVEGIIAWRKGDFSQARLCFERVVGLSQYNGDTHYVSNAYNNLGLIHSTQGRLSDSLECHREALELRRKTKDLRGQAASCNNLGVVEENLGDYSAAEEHYLESLKLSQISGFKEAETAVLANLGQLSEIQGKLALALEYDARSLEIADLLGDIRSRAIAYDNMGNACLACGESDKAEEYYSEALEIAQRIGDPDISNRAILGLCFLHLRENDISGAQEFLDRSEKILQTTDIEDTRARFHRASAEILLLKNEFQKARQQAEAARELAETLGYKREISLSDELLARIG